MVSPTHDERTQRILGHGSTGIDSPPVPPGAGLEAPAFAQGFGEAGRDPQREHFDRIYRIIGIPACRDIQRQHHVNPVDPVQLSAALPEIPSRAKEVL